MAALHLNVAMCSVFYANAISDEQTHTKFANLQDSHTHYTQKSVAVNGSACILCQACLIECEGECIHIIDNNGTKYQSIYK